MPQDAAPGDVVETGERLGKLQRHLKAAKANILEPLKEVSWLPSRLSSGTRRRAITNLYRHFVSEHRDFVLMTCSLLPCMLSDFPGGKSEAHAATRRAGTGAD